MLPTATHSEGWEKCFCLGNNENCTHETEITKMKMEVIYSVYYQFGSVVYFAKN